MRVDCALAVQIVHMDVQLSTKRRLAVSRYGGNVLVSIREYYEKNGDMLPGKKGEKMMN